MSAIDSRRRSDVEAAPSIRGRDLAPAARRYRLLPGPLLDRLSAVCAPWC